MADYQNKAEQLLKELFSEFEKNGAVLDRCNSKDLSIIKEILNKKNFTVWINDYHKLIPYFINNYGAADSGFETNELTPKGFALYQELIHPDHFNDLQKTVGFFQKNPKLALETTYRTKNAEGVWRWIYTYAKTFHYGKDGSVKYILTLSFDIVNVINKLYVEEDEIGLLSNVQQKIDETLLNHLTNREKEILNLIGDCKTSREISTDLKISASTVDTHRKNLIKKLNLRNSMELVRFSNLNKLAQQTT